MDEPQAYIYEFGDFRVDASKRLLLKGDGEIVRLTPKVFDTLLYLVEHSGKIIEKDELMREIWADTIVEENNLSQNISILRRVLGEKRGEHRFIATIPGRGFRFIPKVCEIASVDERKAEEKSQPESPDRLSSRKAIHQPRIWLMTITGIVVIGLGIMAFNSWRTNPASPSQIKSVAVLPFKPLVLENRDEALEMGMTETLITRLGSSREIAVRPLSSVRKYGNLEQDAAIAGRALDVDSILDGSIQRWRDNIRVNMRLIDVADGTLLWAKSFDEKFTDNLAVQDSISEKVEAAFKLWLGGDEKIKRFTKNPEAYNLYAKGQFYWLKFPAKEFEKSREYFQQAVDADPNFALAYAGLAEYHGFGAATGALPPEDNWHKSEAAANKALALDDTLPEGYNARAGVKRLYYLDWAGNERDLRQAIKLNPEYAEGRNHYALALAEAGRFEEALEQSKKVLELQPLSMRYNYVLGRLFYQMRRYDSAIEQYLKTLELHPNDAFLHEVLGDVYEKQGRQKEAIAEWNRALTLNENDDLSMILERTYAASGFNAAVRVLWRRKLERLNEKAKSGGYVPAMDYALVYTRLADKEQALGWLAKGEQERNGRRFDIKLDPVYESLRDDRRFQGLLRRVNFSH